MSAMHVEVNGVRLAFRVDASPSPLPGAAKRPRTVAQRGPDPGVDPLTAYPPGEVAERVRLDLRGTGDSEVGPPERIHLEQWAWDLRVFCAAIGIERPVVLAAGVAGSVALLYATRNRSHPAGLVLWEPVWERERIASWLQPDGKELDTSAELARVACPVLVLAASAGAAESARSLAALLPRDAARVERLPGADPAEVRILVDAFVVSLDG
jgi:pimeloyl-ACP methyl ester carboxylesterase